MSPMSPRTLRPRQTLHPEAANWAARVVANGGSVGSSLSAVSKFCVDIDKASLRSKFYRLSLLCGDNLLAALVPLYRSTAMGGTVLGLAKDENVGFVSGDYTLTGSLVGDSVAGKHLRCNDRPFSTMFPAGNDRQAGHMCCAFTGLSSTAVDVFLGIKTNGSGENFSLEGRVGFARGQAWGTRTANYTAANANRNIIINTRNAGVHTVYVGGSSVGTSAGASTTVDTNSRFAVYGSGSVAGGDGVAVSFTGRIYAYSLGDGLTSTEAAAYNTALTTFLDSIGRTA